MKSISEAVSTRPLTDHATAIVDAITALPAESRETFAANLEGAPSAFYAALVPVARGSIPYRTAVRQIRRVLSQTSQEDAQRIVTQILAMFAPWIVIGQALEAKYLGARKDG